MNPRQEFLTTLFASLDEHGVRYCLLRNYGEIYTATDTDVDLLVSHYSVSRFERCLRAAAASAGFRLVHTARYVNYSHVYWHPRLGFTRIDFETEVRWRQFQVLDARQLLDRRMRHQEFFVPDPAHESAVVWVAAIWRGYLSERYRRRLAELFTACADKEELRRTLRGAFGKMGEVVFEFQSHVASGNFDRSFCRRIRCGVIAANLRPVRPLLTLLQTTWADAGRLWVRLRRPVGISLLFVSANRREQDFDELVRRIEFLFPAKKCVFQSFDLSKKSASPARWKLGLRWTRLRTLFKGGLFLRAYRLPVDAAMPSAIHTHVRYLFPSRAFMCMEDSAGKCIYAHAHSGFMTETLSPTPGDDAGDFSTSFIEFVSKILERKTADHSTTKRGAFGVLLGLDGAGKTTLARRLCCLLANEPRFTGVRYFHWRPHARRRIELPLPAFADQPRKKELPRSPLNSFLSAARLLKNALLARVAYHWRVRSQVQSGRLVLVDRYFYNYHLDPASVKFSGPDWLLKMLLPLFPKPDFVITLDAPPEILLSRKRELSEPEIRRQSAVLKSLKFGSMPVIAADAAKPADEVASQTLQALLKTVA